MASRGHVGKIALDLDWLAMPQADPDTLGAAYRAGQGYIMSACISLGLLYHLVTGCTWAGIL